MDAISNLKFPPSLFEAALTDKPDDSSGFFPYNSSAATLLSIASTWAYSDAATRGDIVQMCGMPMAGPPVAFRVTNGAILVDTEAFFLRSEDSRVGVLVFRGTEFGRRTS